LDVVCDGVDVLGKWPGYGAEFAVVEIEEDRWLDAKFFASASGFSAAGIGERISRGNFREIV
jgi:hypothetical protein